MLGTSGNRDHRSSARTILLLFPSCHLPLWAGSIPTHNTTLLRRHDNVHTFLYPRVHFLGFASVSRGLQGVFFRLAGARSRRTENTAGGRCQPKRSSGPAIPEPRESSSPTHPIGSSRAKQPGEASGGASPGTRDPTFTNYSRRGGRRSGSGASRAEHLRSTRGNRAGGTLGGTVRGTVPPSRPARKGPSEAGLEGQNTPCRGSVSVIVPPQSPHSESLSLSLCNY